MSQFAITTRPPVGVGTSRSNVRPSRSHLKAMWNAPIDYSAAAWTEEPGSLPVGIGRSSKQDRLLVTAHLQDEVNRQLQILKAATRAGTTTTTQTITTTYKGGVTPATRRISSSVRRTQS